MNHYAARQLARPGRADLVAPPSRRWPFGSLVITAHDRLDWAETESFWHLYEAAFGPLRTRAAARQFLSRAEFEEEMADARVTKYLAREGGRAVGMATMTRELSSIPWISPEFYAARYPEQSARNAVYYLGFILVHPDLRSSRVFHRLNQVVTDIVAALRGVLAYDICGFNNQHFRLADRIESFVRRRLPSRFEQVDTQDYYAIDFDVDGSGRPV